MRYLAIAVIAATATNGCAIVSGKKLATSSDLSSACAEVASYVKHRSSAARGTTPTRYDTLVHEFQRTCPARARAAGQAWPQGPKCRAASESRFACTAYDDTRVPRESATQLVRLVSH